MSKYYVLELQGIPYCFKWLLVVHYHFFPRAVRSRVVRMIRLKLRCWLDAIQATIHKLEKRRPSSLRLGHGYIIWAYIKFWEYKEIKDIPDATLNGVAVKEPAKYLNICNDLKNMYRVIARKHGPVIWKALHNEGIWRMDTWSRARCASDYVSIR